MLDLIKKDFLVTKRFIYFIIGLSLVMPVFLDFMTLGAKLPFWLINNSLVLIYEIMVMRAIYDEEEKFPKAKALITTIGYDRKTQIQERFLVVLLVYVYTTVVTGIEASLLKNLAGIDLVGVVTSLIICLLVYGNFLLLTTKFGSKAGKYINFLVILAVSLLPSVIARFNIRIDFSFLKGNENIAMFISLVIAVVWYYWMMKKTIVEYEKKDL